MGLYYTEYSDYLHRLFGPVKMQKLSINAGFTCPNRDGRIGRGGCVYCNNSGFTPHYCTPADSVAEQIRKGKEFFSRKYPTMRYLAYFQSYTSTYGDLDTLERIYSEALAQPGVDGIVIGTRPDCMGQDVLNMLSGLNSAESRVIVEYGAESIHDRTLRLINRNHTAACLRDAIERTASAGISCGVHLIMGLPGETEREMMQTVDEICALPIDTVKFHQLQIVSGTPLAAEWHRQQAGQTSAMPPLKVFSLEEYIALCVKIVSHVPRRIAIERFTSHTPPQWLIAPRWGLKNYEFTHRLHKELKNAGEHK